MKKFFVFLIVLFFVIPVFGEEISGGVFIPPSNIPTLRYTSDNETGVYKTTDVSSLIITAGVHKILGFVVYPISVNSENVATLHDTTTAITDTTILGELECVDENFSGVWFPYPIPLTYGLRIIQGGQTRVIVYYTKH